MKRCYQILAAAAALCTASFAMAWDAPTHRLITLLALDRFHERAGTPVWFGDGDMQAQVADGAVMPDRYRSVKVAQLTHTNNVDHYIDIEDLDAYGMKFFEISPLRNEFITQMVLAKAKAGADFKGRPVNPAMDPAKVNEWPGFLPHAILEHYGKLKTCFLTYRILEGLNEPRRADQLKMMRMQMCVEMGMLSHFVGDAAQPLHTTKHHHGWVGENPDGYTTDRGIHAYVDGDLPRLHKFQFSALRDAMPMLTEMNPQDPWSDVQSYIWRSHEMVGEVYRMKKTGDLEGLQGSRLIGDRLMEAGSMLGALYLAAWDSSAPTQKEIEDFQKYDGIPSLQELAAPEGAAPLPAVQPEPVPAK